MQLEIVAGRDFNENLETDITTKVLVNEAMVKEITVQELKAMRDQGDDHQLVDVREQNEYDFANLQGDLIPMSSFRDHIGEISKDKKVVVHCRSGKPWS